MKEKTTTKPEETPKKEATPTPDEPPKPKILKSDIPNLDNIFGLAKQSSLANDDLLLQIIAFKRDFMPRLEAHIEG